MARLVKQGRGNHIPPFPRKGWVANVKRRIVEAREYERIETSAEHVAEFDYSPTACGKAYRVVVLRKDLRTCKGQAQIFDNFRYFFYITNRRDLTPTETVLFANKRCNQENLIEH